MNFTELRNGVEHVAAGIRQAGVDEHGPDAEASLLATAVLVFGEVLVGIYEELHAIRKAADALALFHPTASQLSRHVEVLTAALERLAGHAPRPGEEQA